MWAASGAVGAGKCACPRCGSPHAESDNFCVRCGAAVSPAVPPERRFTSILFADLVDFTELAERTDAEDVRELLSGYFALCRMRIEALGGAVEKFIGDAVMAVWGATGTREDDAERAVRAALELSRAVEDYGRASGLGVLAVRIGIVTREVAVVLGAAGEGMVTGAAVNLAARLQAAAAPGTVLTDAHTRTLTVDRIDYGREMLVAVKGIADEVPAYPALRVISETGSGAAPAREILSALVGRDGERDVLAGCFERVVATGRPHVAVVAADAGLGKSRLVLELRDHLDHLPMAIMWHSARCLTYGEGIAYSALSRAVRARVGAVEGESERVTIARLRTKLVSWTTLAAGSVPSSTSADVDVDVGADVGTDVNTDVGADVGADVGTDVNTDVNTDVGVGVGAGVDIDWICERLAPLLGADADYSREEFFTAWSLWFERMAAGENAPVVWVIEDAQWADDGLLDFVQHLRRTCKAPVLVVVVTRPELLGRRLELGRPRELRQANELGRLHELGRPNELGRLHELGRPRESERALTDREARETGDADGAAETTLLELGPLDDEAIAALIAALAPELPDDIRRTLSVRVGGVPLYARELLRSLVDEELLLDTPAGLRLPTGVDARMLADADPPASLRVLIASRLDALDPQARLVAQLASVLGFSFSIPALAAVARRHASELARSISTLETRGILISITDSFSSERGQFVFSHPLIRQVAYEMQSRRLRSERHLATVAFLESVPIEASTVAAVIAQHLVDALQLQSAPAASTEPAARRAIHWLLAAADSARRLGSGAAARRLYEQAIEVWPLAHPAGVADGSLSVSDLAELARTL